MIFSHFNYGKLELSNRIAMAPMTRSRTTQPGDVPNDMMATYYAQRANAGLIITEGAPISAIGRGYSLTPGIYTQAHIDGWKKSLKRFMTKAVKYSFSFGTWGVAAMNPSQVSRFCRHRPLKRLTKYLVRYQKVASV